jgi:SAM-dependent methyltransferase
MAAQSCRKIEYILRMTVESSMSFAKVVEEIAKLHPEMRLGGYCAHDGTVEFYCRVKLLVKPDSVVVDLGAGRGAWFEDDESEFRRRTRLLKGNVARVIGLDVDRAVLDNRAVDAAHVIDPGGHWPVSDASIDLVVSDYVIEHVADIRRFSEQIHRILKPGGWFCARTPTKYNYVAIGARLISNLNHARLLKLAQPGRKSEDVFPTEYRLNTRTDIARAFGVDRFEDFSYTYCCEPQYSFGRLWIYRCFLAAHRLLPPALVGNLFVFLRKSE